MNLLEKEISSKLKENSPYDFPGLKIAAIHGGKKVLDMSYGKTWEYYDIASLTKIVFTTSLFMKLEEENKNLIHKKVKSFLPWYRHPEVSIKQLLSHSAGYEWWRPFYKYIDLSGTPDEKFNELLWEVREIPLTHKGRGAIYSDIDFFFLGALVEKIYNKPLIEVWKEFREANYSALNIHFNYKNKPQFKRTSYAPTEKCPWRHKILQGEVHDDNTWALGGVAPHAGLFARMKDMIDWAQLIRGGLKGQKSFVKPSVLKQFTKRSMVQSKGDWGLGFMMPSAQSSAGKLFSKSSFGHTGFTGTSFWFDTKRDLILIILSNRVYKTRKNKDFISLRPQIHDWVVEALER